MSLTAEQIKARDGRLTASRVGVLMSGDPEKIMALWEEMTGQREPEDLSGVWAVQLGSLTESLNLDWYELKTGRAVSHRGEVVVCPNADWAASTLDGFDEAMHAPIECKHVGGFEPREKIIERYTAQFHWQMICTETETLIASIIEGAREPVLEFVDLNHDYAYELWKRAEQFMACVRDLTPPVALPPVAAPEPVTQYRTVDMSGSNAWASYALDWLANQGPAKAFDKATKELKALVEIDVSLASGHGIQIKRSKAGALSVSAMKG